MQVVLSGAFTKMWAMSVGFTSRDLFTSEVVSACKWLLFILWAWTYWHHGCWRRWLHRKLFCPLSKIVFSYLFGIVHLSCFHKLLLHAWQKSIKYVDYRAFLIGGLCCLIPERPEQSNCLLLRSSQWTKPGTQTHKRLLKSLEKIDPFTKMPFMPWSGHCWSTQPQTDVHWNSNKTLSHLTLSTVFLLFTQTVRILSPYAHDVFVKVW